MKYVRLITITLAVLLALMSVMAAFAYDGDAGHLTGGGPSTGELYVGFAAIAHYTLGFATGSFPGGVHAEAPPYAVSDNVPDWVSTANISGNFTTSMSPFGCVAGIIESAATAGNTPSQLPFIVISTVILLIVSLGISFLLRSMSANGSLFAKGLFCLTIMGLFVATRWWDLWMLGFFVIFFAAFGIMSRHQSWQN